MTMFFRVPRFLGVRSSDLPHNCLGHRDFFHCPWERLNGDRWSERLAGLSLDGYLIDLTMIDRTERSLLFHEKEDSRYARFLFLNNGVDLSLCRNQEDLTGKSTIDQSVRELPSLPSIRFRRVIQIKCSIES
jgi:hypothetical protein